MRNSVCNSVTNGVCNATPVPTRPVPTRPVLVSMAGFQNQSGLRLGIERDRVSERFWAKVSVGLGCWIWNASKSKSGYGQFWDGSTMVRAHRWSYRQARGEIPAELECDHLCRNKACVNPWHIELVSHAVNVERRVYRHDDETRRRMAEKARARWAAKRAERDATGWWVCI